MVGFTDSDWEGDTIDQNSTPRYVFTFCGGTIFWSIKKKSTIAFSLAEAEYKGAVNACIQVVWLQGILSEFEIGITLSTAIFCDNQSYVKISMDLVTRKRTKHVDTHMHYIRELVHDRTTVLQYCPTNEQIAYIFTKSFTEKNFT